MEKDQLRLPLALEEKPKPLPAKRSPSQHRRIELLENRVTELEAEVARLSYQMDEEGAEDE